ncbi:aryl-alcohol dehydrogenase-like predicted oxidoreductase [Amycolatopsis sulphurea]|uniref:Aryl-alcohol dehydrogenase-like predicted oxidoreductase n=1 Tax=Amycolatopsis sulphurea TaxID=76022 RepID=A0A2A9FHR7_9PSEU|nr:aldo/keto reductase [Amycolatopsis sulphurea]PFG49985.1 aryl-alcohol dehydrogenase-like predicted oxidoreductase [Amycolatopsis sulphurea]
MTIPTRVLGRTGVEVSILGYGSMELRGPDAIGGPAISDEDAGRLLNEVLDAGVSLIDTSADYGRSEELLGRYLGSRRDEFFLASKCGCPLTIEPGWDPPAVAAAHDYTADRIRTGVEQSLGRLRTDHLNLLQVHMSPARTQLESDGTIEELEKLRAEGKVQFIGMSGVLPHLPDHIAMGVFDVFQIPYSAVQDEHEPYIVRAAQAGAGILIRGGTARGTASDDKSWSVEPLSLSGAKAPAKDLWNAAGLDDIIPGDMSRHEFLLRFTLSHPALSSAIVGTSSLAHFMSNAEIASRGPLPAELYDEAKRRLAAGSGDRETDHPR